MCVVTPPGWPEVVAEFRYTLAGRPETWKRDNVIRGRFITDAAVRSGKLRHSYGALGGLGRDRARWPLAGAFEVHVVGYYANAVTGDSDRLTTLVMDGLEGIAYGTDRQVRGQSGYILADGSPERVEVLVRRLARDPVQPRKRAPRKPRAA